MPYRILFVNRDETESIYSESGYQRVQSVITEMVEHLDYTNYKDLVGSVMIESTVISYQDTEVAIDEPQASPDPTYIVQADTNNREPDHNGLVSIHKHMFTIRPHHQITRNS